jgi:hypothetical protein
MPEAISDGLFMYEFSLVRGTFLQLVCNGLQCKS